VPVPKLEFTKVGFVLERRGRERETDELFQKPRGGREMRIIQRDIPNEGRAENELE